MNGDRKRGYRFTHPETGIEYVFDGAAFVVLDGPEGRRIIAESAAPESRTPSDSEGQSGLAGFARTAAQGATFGLSDELAGLAAALPGGKTPEEARAGARQNLAQYREDHPGMAIGAEMLGGLATGLLVPGGAARAIPTLGRGLRSARAGQRALAAGGLGAAEGALYGAGQADEGGRLGGAVKGGLAGLLLGGGIGAAMPAPTGWVGGGRAPTRGGQAVEAVDAARGGPRRAPARAPRPDPADIPVTPIGQQGASPGLLGRARQGVGEAMSRARQAVADKIPTPPTELQRLTTVNTEGLLRPSAWGAEATEQALRPVTRAGSQRLGQLDDAHRAAAQAFDDLDNTFQAGWSGKNRPGMSKAQLDAANRDVVRLVQEISEHPEARDVLSRAAGPFRDMTSIDNIRTVVRNADGTLRNPQSVKRLGHREVKALWQNLRTMSGDVAEADVFFTKFDGAYRRLFGEGTDAATSGYKKAIQDLDAFRMGRGSVRNLAGRKMRRPELFNRGALQTPDGLRIAIKEISEHGGVGDTQRTLGNFMEGLFDTEVRQAITKNPEAALKKLTGRKEWLRMFFKPGKEGDKAFNGAWKEIQALAKAGDKKGGITPKKLLTLGLLGGGTTLAFNLFD